MDKAVKASRTRDFSKARRELKYIVPIDLASRFVEAMDDLVMPDSNAVNGSYRVTSLYYDTSDLRAYREKLDGEDPRYKLRLRYYRDVPADSFPTPDQYFLEAKHRHDQLVSKTRCRIPSNYMNPSESGAIFSPGVRSLANDEDQAAADELDRILLEAEHLPYAVVSYTRKPYFYRLDRNVRITIDTDIRALVPSDYLNSGTNVGLSILPAHMAVVEIKFYWAMPHWLTTLATNSGFQLRRFSKYASALEAIYPSITSRSLRLANFR